MKKDIPLGEEGLTQDKEIIVLCNGAIRELYPNVLQNRYTKQAK